MRRFGKQPFAWNGKSLANANLTSDNVHSKNIASDTSKEDQNASSRNDAEVQTCRNSVQGRVSIADDQGNFIQ